jgi:hypothetical protein
MTDVFEPTVRMIDRVLRAALAAFVFLVCGCSSDGGGSKKLLKRITQEKGVINISSTAINP